MNLRRLLLSATLAFALAAPAAPAWAQDEDTERERTIEEADQRFKGFDAESSTVVGGGYFLTYLAFVGLAVVTIGVMFKSARRSHLD